MQESPKNTELETTKFKTTHIIELSAALGACLLTQRTYGRQGGEIEALTDIFLDDLKNYEPEHVLAAIKKWRLVDPNFPTPADIINLLEKKPKLDKALYIRAQKIASDYESKFSKSWQRDGALKYCQFYEKEMTGDSF